MDIINTSEEIINVNVVEEVIEVRVVEEVITIQAPTGGYPTPSTVYSVFGRTGAIIGQSGDYNTSQVTENGNLYYTDLRARASITLSTSGTSGVATYNSTTGLLNIPNYQSGVLSFNGRTGAIMPIAGDYTTSIVSEGTNLYFTEARARASLIAGTGITYISSTGAISCSITQYTDALARQSISAGSGISYNNTTGVITNSSQDQTVVMTASTGITITGTYPSFTIASSIVQYTDASARNSISVATVGNSGAAYYNATTGVINVPQYTLAGLGGQATFVGTGFVKSTLGVVSYDNSTYYLASNPSGYTTNLGTVTSVIGTGTISGITLTGTITNSGSIALGGALTLTSLQVTNGLGFTPVTNARTLTINGTTYDLSADRSWTIAGGVASVFGRTGVVVAVSGDYTTTQVTEGTNLYYTDLRARGSISLTTTGTTGLATYNSTTGVLNIPGYGNAGFTEQVQHPVKAAVAINKGQAVYVSSANGTNMLVSLASNTAELTSSKTMGLIDATVAVNGFANVVTEGLLSGIDTSTATVGDAVWLGTNGNLLYGIANKPFAPAHLVSIGIVTRVNANNGEIYVRCQNGFEIEELHNVSAYTPSDGDILKYVTSTGLWTKTAGTTANITEVTNLYYTDARARASMSLTTTGTSGAATYSSTTGILNIPNHTLAGLGGQPSNTNLTSLSGLSYVSASFVKMTAAGTFTLDTNTYYLSSNPSGYTNNTGTVTSISVVSANGFAATIATNTTTPAITISTTITGILKGNGTAISAATAGTDYQAPITLTTTGTSGAATFSSNTLNIPNHTLAGLGGQALSTNLTSLSGLTYVSGSFVKMTAAGTFTLDTSTYLTANQTITLSGAVTGSGTTAITTTLAANAVSISNINATGTASSTTYLRGDGTWATVTGGVSSVFTRTGAITAQSGDYNTSQVTESGNLYYTDTRARASISITTVGSSGAATYNSTTGVLNIPQYTGGGGGVAGYVSRTITTFTATAAQTTFTVTYIAGNIDVFMNGSKLNSSEYTASNGTSVVLSDAAKVGDIVEVYAYDATSFLTSFSASAPLSYNSSTGAFSISQATTSANGYLTSTDWNTFNGKQYALGFTPYNATNPSNYIALTALSSTATGLTYTNTTGVFSLTSGYVIPTTTSATNWDTAYINRITSLTTTGSSGAATLTTNTLNIPTYTLTGLGGISLTSLSATTPLSYNNTTGAFTIQVANTSQNGYLTSTDWNTFNGKLNTANPNFTGVLNTGTLTYTPVNHLMSLQSSVNSYNQIVFQNSNSGTSASADMVVNNNLSTDSTYYGDYGINSSTFVGTGSLGLPNATYLSSTTGDLVLGSTTNNAIHFVINGGTIDAATIQTTKQLTLQAYTSTTSFVGTAVGYLAFDSSGNIITVAPASGGGGVGLLDTYLQDIFLN